MQPRYQYILDTTGLAISFYQFYDFSLFSSATFFSAFTIAFPPFCLSFLVVFLLPYSKMAFVLGVVRRAFVLAYLIVNFTLIATICTTSYDLLMAFLFPHIHLIVAGGNCETISRQSCRRYANDNITDVVFNSSSSFFSDGGF